MSWSPNQARTGFQIDELDTVAISGATDLVDAVAGRRGLLVALCLSNTTGSAVAWSVTSGTGGGLSTLCGATIEDDSSLVLPAGAGLGYCASVAGERLALAGAGLTGFAVVSVIR